MTTSTRSVSFLGFLLLGASALVPGSVRAVCPTDLCDCYGEAAAYRAVAADRFRATVGLARELSPPALVGSLVAGSACAIRADLAEPTNGDTQIDGDLVALTAAGSRAVRSRIAGPDGAHTVLVTGIIATGGGAVFGPVSADAIDTTGAHPGVASCQAAISDMIAASQTLAALPPSQSFDTIIVPASGELAVNAGPGVSVVNVAGKLTAFGNLRLVLQPTTDALVINTRTMFVRGSITVEGGDETKAVINLTGPGKAVIVKSNASVAPLVLAPERVVKVSTRGDIAGAFARRVFLNGASASQVHDVCATASPSGAFLDTPAAF